MTINTEAMLTAVRRMRAVYADMTSLQIEYLLAIATEPGISLRRLADIMHGDGPQDGISSRTVALLGDIGSRTVPALGLIEIQLRDGEPKERYLCLSEKGKALMVEA